MRGVDCESQSQELFVKPRKYFRDMGSRYLQNSVAVTVFRDHICGIVARNTGNIFKTRKIFSMHGKYYLDTVDFYETLIYLKNPKIFPIADTQII